MKTKYITFVSLVLAALTTVSCKQDNSFKNTVGDSELLSKFAKQISYNVNQDSKLTGIFTLSLSANQSFDSYYWGWLKPGYYLTNSNKTISSLQTLANPLPTTSASYSDYVVYGDGGTPFNTASTGTMYPVEITAKTQTTYDTSGNKVTPVTEDTYVVGYDTQTGLIDSAVETTYDTAGSFSQSKTYSFTTDPRGSSRYYTSSYILRSGVSTIAGSTTTQVTLTETALLKEEVVTNTNYTTSNTPADFTENSFGTANSATIVKQVVTTSTYYDASGDTPANAVITTTDKYSSDTVIVWKEVITTAYSDKYLGKISTYLKTQHNVAADGVTTSLAFQESSTYSKGMVIETRNYSISGGAASLSSIYAYTYDSKNRLTLFATKDSSSRITKQITYNRDATTGALDSVRTVAVNVSTSAETCSAGNYDYTYETITVIGITYKRVTKTIYDCSGDSLGSAATSKSVNTYNSKMQLSSTQEYTYTVGEFILDSQTDYTYDSSGLVTKQQNYSVSAGIATASSYVIYAYDNNKFLVSSISYSSADAVTGNYTVSSYTYK